MVLLAVVLAVALAPWVRNRGYLRSFYDYGVVMGGVGRIDQGQKPYVDFVIPIQTGWFLFNRAAEKIAGGTFQAMTWSAAVCTLLATFGLGGMLLRRWPTCPAIIVTAAIVCATVIQHTIFWYNPWGVVLLAVVAWGGAVAPVWRRETAGWHVLVGIALLLGGINKISMQLVAICLALGWAVRAALLARASWARVLGTAALVGITGMVLPVLVELAWTGASPQQWWHNVIGLLGGSRSGMLLTGLKWEFFLRPCHDYYGPLRLPWVGLAGVLLTLVTTIAILRHVAGGPRAGLERALVGLCGVIAFLGGEVLLTTNMDIAYTALGGWLALLVALWLGFGVPARGAWFQGGIVLPALVIGAVSWEAAWRGQRSQFGYSEAPRSAYRSADEAGGMYGYFRGTHLPPEMFNGLKAMGEWREALPPDRANAVLNGPGTEFAAHIWPALRTPELPLYILGGYQFTAREYDATRAAVASGRFKEITVTKVLDYWVDDLARHLQLKYRRLPLEWVFFHYSRVADENFTADPIYFLEHFGGTTDPRLIESKAEIFAAANNRYFFGTSAGRMTMRVRGPINRMQGEVMLRRQDAAFTGALAANFKIFAEYDSEHRYPRWEQRVELPAGQDEIVVPYVVDASHMASYQEVEIPVEFAGKVAAGWRGPVITHAGEDGPAAPRWLEPYGGLAYRLPAEDIASILPADVAWRPDEVWIRRGRLKGGVVELEPGGEIWLRVTGLVTEFTGSASLARDVDISRISPAFTHVWLKDGRIEKFLRKNLGDPERRENFRGWSAEPGGWLVLATDYQENGPVITLHIDRLVQQPWP